MPYWEIWNEPDLDADDSLNKRCWGGTKAEFFDLYEITAKHLKKCFPHLKIGGPASCGNTEWSADFLCEMQKREVPIDFFSWHIYTTSPDAIAERARVAQEIMEKNGYRDAENILNEWNYVKGWTDDFKYSINMIHGLKNASFILSAMAVSQPSPIDMLMYYDTRPSEFNGVFDFYSYDPLKGYYPMKWYGMFYDLEAEVRSENTVDGIYSLCGTYKDGKSLCMLTYYSDDDNAPQKEIKIDFGKNAKYEIYLLDAEKDGELVETTSTPVLKLSVHSCVLIKEI
jgi:hypothetical protein